MAVAGPACEKSAERSQEAYCAELNRQKASFQPRADVPREQTYADAAEAFDKVRPRAPVEIRRDVDRVAEELHQIADLAAQAKGDPAKADTRRLVQIALDNKAANDRVNAYNKERCGLDTSGGASP